MSVRIRTFIVAFCIKGNCRIAAVSSISVDTHSQDSPTVSGEEAMNSRLGVVRNISLFQIVRKSCESENVFL